MISSIVWAVGYGLVWITKWILVSITYNKELIQTAIKQFRYRAINETSYPYSETVYRNMILYIGFPMIYMAFMILETIVELVMCKIKKVPLKQNMKKTFPYVIIALMPFVWYFVIRDHSYNHAFFTYRNLLLVFIGVPLALQKIIEKEEVKKIEEKNEEN